MLINICADNLGVSVREPVFLVSDQSDGEQTMSESALKNGVMPKYITMDMV